MVGALLCEPHREDCRFGVIFFNNVGVLGMCGHGTIGLIASLAWRFSSHRMVMDYCTSAYLPAAGGISCEMNLR